MTGLEFKRMVIGLPQNLADQAAVDAAAALAELLDIELLATFVADSSLHALAGFPAARELRLLDQAWQAIDLERITRDIERTADVARARFAEAVGRRTIRTRFDVVSGAELIASLIRADDIVAIIEPSHPGERITRQFTGLLDAAMATAGAILVVPRHIVRSSGPIVALAAAPEDASIRVGLELAAALKEELVVVASAALQLSAETASAAQRLGVRVRQIAADEAAASTLAPAPLRLQERLRVATQTAHDGARLFSTLQGVPLLAIPPDRAKLAAQGGAAAQGRAVKD